MLDAWLGLQEVRWSDAATSLGFRYPLPAWAWGLIVLAAAGLAWASYRNLRGRLGLRLTVASLRGLLLLWIVVLLAGPQLVRTDERVEKDVLLVLVDRSASLTVRDQRDATGSLSRDEALQNSLRRQAPAVFGPTGLAQGRDLLWLGFGEQAADLPNPLGKAPGNLAPGTPAPGTPDSTDVLTFDPTALGPAAAPGTALRSALEEALRRAAGRPLTGIVLLTDGRSPQDTGPATLARLTAESIRIYPVPLGAADAPLDLTLRRVEPPRAAFINDTVPVTVVVDETSLGTSPELTRTLNPADVTVRLIDRDTGEVLDERTLAGVGLGQPLRLEGRSATVGEKNWAVEVQYQAARGSDPSASDTSGGEINLVNNVEAFTVALIDRPIRVLYVEGYPRWEYRYLKNMLLREASIDSSIFLLSADRAFAQEGDTPITRLPEGPEEWRRYDVVILGDVPAETLSTTQRQDLWDQVARRGSGLLWIGGAQFTPGTWANSPVADLLPMRDPAAVTALPWGQAAVLPTPLARALSVLQIADPKEEAHADPAWVPSTTSASADNAWPDALPPLRWVQGLGPLKPTAEVLGLALPPGMDPANPDSAASAADGLDAEPLVVRLRFGAGQTLYVGTDETWRWRYGRGELYFERFWVQLVRQLGREAATRGDALARLEVSTRRLPVGGTAAIELTLDDPALLQRNLSSVEVTITPVDGGAAVETVTLQREADPRWNSEGFTGEGSSDASGGGYRGTWAAGARWSGMVNVRVTEPALADLGLQATVEVVPPDDEVRQPQTDHPRLLALAEGTGGQVVPLDKLDELLQPGVVRNLARRIANDVAEPLGNSALALTVLLSLLTAEWILRKVIKLV